MSSYSLSAADKPSAFRWVLPGARIAAALLVNLLALYLVVALYAQQQIAFALLVLVVVGSASYIFFTQRAYVHRYVFPAVAGMVVFVIFPLLYTIGIGFTNYSASNLLDLERVQQYHLSQTFTNNSQRYGFKVHQVGNSVRLILNKKGETDYLVTEPVNLEADNQPVPLKPGSAAIGGDLLKIRDVIKLKKPLQALVLETPDGHQLRMNSLRAFSAIQPLYSLQDDGSLLNNKNGEKLTINYDEGFYQKSDGSLVSPGFVVTIGFDNFLRVISDSSIREPFMDIFGWTLVFSGGTVVFTLAVGLVLANLLQWNRIGGKAFYRTFLMLPYAVPAFISILVFKGLFNQNFGEINMVLEGLFGLRPDWFSDPTMARSMILIVNTWLGYPYMMLLCMGLLQSIPSDLYEASAMDGAGPLDNLFKITLPLIIKPLTPLLIASFAFNFNNFVLISLLTSGAPDIIGASTPAGTTDLLVSYTYRIAFQDSGQDFGLAAAIATFIFLLVGGMALAQLKLSKMEV